MPLVGLILYPGLVRIATISTDSADSVDYPAELRKASSFDDAKELMLTVIVAKLSKALDVPCQDIDTSRSIHAYCVVSLLAVELRNWFARALQADIAVFDIMGAESITAVSILLAARSSFVYVKEEPSEN